MGVYDTEITQYVENVPSYSSQYGSKGSISYVVTNLTGPQKMYPTYGDHTTSAVWRTYGPWWQKLDRDLYSHPRKADFISQDYVDLVFTRAVWPSGVHIYETYHPGAVVRILACDTTPENLNGAVDHAKWFVLWSGQPQEGLPQESRIFSPPIQHCPFPTRLLRLELNQTHCGYYTELDTVLLLGHPTQPRGYKKALQNAIIDLTTPTETSVDSGWKPPALCAECGGAECGNGCVECMGTAVKQEDDSTPRCWCPCMQGHGAPYTSQNGVEGQVNSAVAGNPAAGDNTSASQVAGASHVTSMERISKQFAELGIQSGLPDALDLTDNGHFDLLPYEVVQHILSYLDLQTLAALSAVCQMFYKHCHDPMQYINLDLQPYWDRVTDDVLESFATRCRFVQSVNLSWCGAYNLISPATFLSFCDTIGKDLQCLRLASCNFVTEDCLNNLVDKLPKLTCLDLQNLALPPNCDAFKRLRHVTSLNLYNTRVREDALKECIKNNPQLEELNIGACPKENDYDKIARCLAQNCKQLRILDMWRNRSLTGSGVQALAEGCHLLQQLDLGWCDNVKSYTGCFQSLATNCRFLKKIFLTANRSANEADIRCFAQHLPALEQLDLLGNSHVDVASVQRLLDSCQNLCFLDVSFCSQIKLPQVVIWRTEYPHVDVKNSFTN